MINPKLEIPLIIFAVLGLIFLLLVVNAFVINPFLNSRKNQKEVTAKTLNANSITRYHKFNYMGEIYYEAPDQKSAKRMFKNFVNTNKKFKAYYDKARKEKDQNNSKKRRV